MSDEQHIPGWGGLFKALYGGAHPPAPEPVRLTRKHGFDVSEPTPAEIEAEERREKALRRKLAKAILQGKHVDFSEYAYEWTIDGEIVK